MSTSSPKTTKYAVALHLTLSPWHHAKYLMAAGNPQTQAWLERHGITCITTPVDELAKAAGAIGCLTGIIAREM
jgi:N-dimethylarginine dimethylaminohydrolase